MARGPQIAIADVPHTFENGRLMPKRTNLFQSVVAIIQRHIAGDAEVEESAELTDALTGDVCEVDVVIRGRTGGHDVTVSIEASKTARPATVEWVREMIGKHEHLETNKLVLVSGSGFSAAARKRAEKDGVATFEPRDLSDDDADHGVLGALRAIWPKQVTFIPTQARVLVDHPDHDGPTWFWVGADLDLFFDDRQVVGTLEEAVRKLVADNFRRIADQIGLRDIEEDSNPDYELEAGPEWAATVDGVKRWLFVESTDSTGRAELLRIQALHVDGKAAIRVTDPIQLSKGKLFDVGFGFGESKLAGAESLVVVTEDESGRRITVRPKPPPKKKMKKPRGA